MLNDFPAVGRPSEWKGVVKPKQSHYATATRNFQHTIERKTFKSIRITYSELPLLNYMLIGHPYRCCYLKTLEIVIQLPSVKEQQGLETIEVWRKSNKVFTENVAIVINTINT